MTRRGDKIALPSCGDSADRHVQALGDDRVTVRPASGRSPAGAVLSAKPVEPYETEGQSGLTPGRFMFGPLTQDTVGDSNPTP